MHVGHFCPTRSHVALTVTLVFCRRGPFPPTFQFVAPGTWHVCVARADWGQPIRLQRSHVALASGSTTACDLGPKQILGSLACSGPEDTLNLTGPSNACALSSVSALLPPRAVTWISRASFTSCWDPGGKAKKGRPSDGAALEPPRWARRESRRA